MGRAEVSSQEEALLMPVHQHMSLLLPLACLCLLCVCDTLTTVAVHWQDATPLPCLIPVLMKAPT